MKKYDALIIGFGKGGKTLATAMGKKGLKVALIEKSPLMYGGTCINIGCIPTKKLIHTAADAKKNPQTDYAEKNSFYSAAIHEKNALTALLRQKNYDNVAAAADIYTGPARFLSDHTVEVQLPEETVSLYGEKIFINTGSETIIPPITGLQASSRVYTSTTLMELDTLPQRLIIVGGGYIGLEFAAMYANYGSSVTVLEYGDTFIPREDRDIANIIQTRLEELGIRFIFNAQVNEITDENELTTVSYLDRISGNAVKIPADAVLVATGRKASTANLNLEAAAIAVNSRGEIIVDDLLRTNITHIWALGDVKGGLQFTYISLDDFRIIKEQLFGQSSRTTANRGPVAYSVFLDPTFARVGLSEAEALQAGHKIKIAKISEAASPRARLFGSTSGYLKAIIDADSNKILGAAFFCSDASEIINIIQLAMKANLDYTVLRDNIYTHPSMSEFLNDLFSTLA
ncbi:FAD-dependent oxidoreductase [uncultured Phascolarctobacterium sp.]|uniref:FAD-dependent oxidoreductase n=1 Tax=uncultured Phascolarctobacterium sp. TaxID=512296 RepID=UPI0027D9AC2D|nr:FAD-dependent oxidoreductase [uncultured Phascolarctobacterium sp.]